MQTALRNVEVDDVRDVEVVLGMLLQRLDPDAIPASDADAMWEFFARITRLSSAGATLMARRVDDSGRWKREQARSAAEHMSKRAGTSVSEAARMLQTSKRLRKLPNTANALRSGVLSAGKAEAIADAATVVPEAEGALLAGAADKTLSDVREECLKVKAKSGPDDRHARIHRERHVRQHTDSEGAWRFHGRGTVDAQAEFKAAHEPILDELFKAARANGEHEPREAYAFDALIEMARRANGQPTTTDAPAAGEKPKRPPARFVGVIRADLAALRRGWIEGDETCEIRGLGPIPVRVARDLLGDAVLKLVITKGVDVANVTHLGRSATVAQQVALWWRSPACTASGCNRTQFVENDHRIEWTETKHTRLDELDPLCTHHHALKTNRRWSLIAGSGKRRMVPPHDPQHPKNKPKR
jgi:hypothetical protein